MSGETEEQPSGWTIDTALLFMRSQHNDLVTLLDERHAAQKEAITAALLSAEKAVTKAEGAAERRFEAVNEFRGQLADQAATLITRSEADVRFDAIAEKVSALASRLDKIEGSDNHASQSRSIGQFTTTTLVAVLALILAAIGVIKVFTG